MTLPKNPTMFRCVLVNENGERMTYIGPFGEWSNDWCMFKRAPLSPRKVVAA